MRHPGFLVLGVGLFLNLAASNLARAEGVGFKVVVSDDVPVSEISREDLSEIFLRRLTTWSDGTPIEPIDLASDSAVRVAFSEIILGRSVSAVESHHQKMIFSGRSVPPSAVPTDQTVVDQIRSRVGAIGYIAVSTPAPSGVRVIEITDCEACSRADGDRILEERGSIRLFLTGLCGSEDKGRFAVVQNRHPSESRQVRVAQSHWIDNRHRASSTEMIHLDPLAEERLGCTEPNRGSEQRYALAEVFDSSAPQEYPEIRRRERPARDLARIVEGGPCGKQAEGQELILVNEHATRVISTRITFNVEIQGKVKQIYSKSYKVAPGKEKKLGCGLDGQVRLIPDLVSADYAS